jgi:NitT/TauT family transport system substrate-binding protein
MKLATFATGSTTDLLLRNGLKANGINPDKDLTIQTFGDAAGLTAAAKQGASDGLVAFPNQSTAPAADGWGDVFIDFLSESKQSVDVPYIVVIANNDFVKNNPDTVKRFLQALMASRDDAKNMSADKKTALKTKYFADSSQQAFDAGLTAILPAFANSILPTQAQADNLLRVYNQSQQKPINASFESIYNTAIVRSIPGA